MDDKNTVAYITPESLKSRPLMLIPEGEEVVSMTIFNDKLYVATKTAVYELEIG